MPIEIIAAVADGGAIGHKGRMPWDRIPRDLTHFKEITMGQTIVMGYTTLVSIGRELSGRNVLALTRDPSKLASFPWCKATTKDVILEMAKTERIIIAGGEATYLEFLRYATIAHITRIRKYFAGDTYFPELPLSEWHLESSQFWDKGDKNPYPIEFETWFRRRNLHEENATI
ncbi:MAG: hypothetical protein A2V96_02755 [Candidatus Yonathbacteria bacterium RBG_16_43_6]|uniref:dihydrofolate reductase n=2 Tax=Parcubacteria group TaxID=1794811 RepID=A0A1G2SDD5_9BACT|nr:MAG: Dihydrofolate reductase [Candidatus Azambacteria bacterium GW2011_GWA1_44_9]OHA78760.1 MAG: hypothetical protein A2V96_02755 [Candidatus Yonathbacteria bacterium RBG_16_43_6]OHA82702.1 MAG: hypothetical protein A3B07_01105 [Candidatus Yonathbacteria bacterium RIFCSPLOWO2_01_FULL_43_27]